MKIPKINSVNFAGKWIAASFLIGLIIPFILWVLLGRVFLVPFIIGGLMLAGFIVVFMIEMIQDNGKVPYYEQDLKETIQYDPVTMYAVIRSSICTGEKVAGFKNKKDGHFTEVMLICTPEDEKRFKEIYEIDTVKVEY